MYYIKLILSRLWVSENRVLMRIYGPKSDVVTGKWRRLHNEELKLSAVLITFYSVDQIGKNVMGGASGTYRGDERFIQNLGGGRREGKRSLGIPMRKWEDNIKTDLRKWNGVK